MEEAGSNDNTKQNTVQVKDVGAEIFQSMDFFCQDCKKGVNDFVSEMKHVENYPDFEKLAHVTQHGLQGFIFKNIEGGKIQNYRSCGSFV